MKRIKSDVESEQYMTGVGMQGTMVAASHDDELWLHSPDDFAGPKLAVFIFLSEKIDKMYELADSIY